MHGSSAFCSSANLFRCVCVCVSTCIVRISFGFSFRTYVRLVIKKEKRRIRIPQLSSPKKIAKRLKKGLKIKFSSIW